MSEMRKESDHAGKKVLLKINSRFKAIEGRSEELSEISENTAINVIKEINKIKQKDILLDKIFEKCMGGTFIPSNDVYPLKEFIKNSFDQGIINKIEDVNFSITISRDDKNVYISYEDNVGGFSDDFVKKAKKNKEEVKKCFLNEESISYENFLEKEKYSESDFESDKSKVEGATGGKGLGLADRYFSLKEINGDLLIQNKKLSDEENTHAVITMVVPKDKFIEKSQKELEDDLISIMLKEKEKKEKEKTPIKIVPASGKDLLGKKRFGKIILKPVEEDEEENDGVLDRVMDMPLQSPVHLQESSQNSTEDLVAFTAVSKKEEVEKSQSEAEEKKPALTSVSESVDDVPSKTEDKEKIEPLEVVSKKEEVEKSQSEAEEKKPALTSVSKSVDDVPFKTKDKEKVDAIAQKKTQKNSNFFCCFFIDNKEKPKAKEKSEEKNKKGFFSAFK